jgi:shikimate kinase
MLTVQSFLIALACTSACFYTHVSAFAPLTLRRAPAFVLSAGGFEWEDPSEAFDQGVENPFKSEVLVGSDEKIKSSAGRLLGPRLNGSNVYFVGIMGSGKSAVGDILARRMGTYNFLDTDEIIERATGMTIPEIFKAEGEEGFRTVEAQVLDSVHPYVRCIISTGGGIVIKLENWSKLQTGLVVWLDCEPEVIMRRIEGTDRPLLQTDNPLQKLKDLLAEREDKYSQADIRIKVTEDMDTEHVADLAIRELHNFIDENPPAWKLAKSKAQAEGLDWVK